MTQENQKMDFQYRKWRTKGLVEKDGIIVASDLNQEWLLPWWWEHYHSFNTRPVAFVDFGMSQEMKAWCRERGELIAFPITDIFVADQSELDPIFVRKMEESVGKNWFWPCRNAWFKKPLACLRSPYRRSIWMDLDCEVRGCLNTLFDLCKSSLAIAKDPTLSTSHTTFNSGVIVFNHEDLIFEEWAHLAIENNCRFRGDQDILSLIIHEQKINVIELPQIYNWSRRLEKNPKAIVLHWHGQHGKNYIQHMIQRSNLQALGFIA